MRRQQLTETQALFDPPTEPRELIRLYVDGLLASGLCSIARESRGRLR
jgi:hypothetical protein